MNMLVSGAALLLACIAFFAYDQITFRQSLVRTLSAQAQIIASNSVSALLFNDPQSASNTLSALKNSTNLTSAGILTADGHPFAQYVRQPGDEPLSIPALSQDQRETYHFDSMHAIVVRKVLSEGQTVGFVYIQGDLREVNKRLQKYAIISAIVLLVSLAFALLVSSAFRRSVAQPIVRLAETARIVSRNKDYSVRVPGLAERDEIAVLIDSFNEMLREIQQRDDRLQQAQEQLEKRVTERTRELLLANQELEAFAYAASHDLRGPLDALNGFSYLLMQQHGDKLSPGGKEIVDHIRAAGKRMTELIEDLLNLSRVTSSAMHIGEVNLAIIARSIVEELRRSSPERKLEFVVSDMEDTRGDARLLRIVLENLLRNSWKYTSAHKQARIQFGTESQNGRTVYFVRDDGAGFDPRFAGRLFQPFQRLHSSEEFPGNGIGLTTVQRIVRRHGGEIWAEGAVEKGATFYFTLGEH
jgi:signal transduction histidine kinase